MTSVWLCFVFFVYICFANIFMTVFCIFLIFLDCFYEVILSSYQYKLIIFCLIKKKTTFFSLIYVNMYLDTVFVCHWYTPTSLNKDHFSVLYL